MWFYILTILLAPALVWLLRAVAWIYKVHFTIRGSYAPFLVEKPHWLYGHILVHGNMTQEGLIDNLEWTRRSECGAYAFYLPFGQALVLSHPDTIKKVMKTAQPKGFLPATGESYILLKPWLGLGLLTSSGKQWARNRRLLTPGFHFDVLKPYMKTFNECSNNLSNKFASLGSRGESVEIFSLVSLCTLSVILKCAFSVDEQVQDLGDRVPYVKNVYDLGRLVMERMYRPHWFIDAIYYHTQHGKNFAKMCEISQTYAKDVIRNRQKQLKQGDDPTDSKRHLDFLDILLLAKDEDGTGLTEQEILDEVETFMFEAHDTTACGLSWMLYNLARHPEIQATAQQEIDQVLEGREDPDLTWEDMNKIPYTTRCIKESLRIHPPVPTVYRELTEPLEIGGHIIQPGSVVDLNIRNVHYNQKVWGKDADRYDPDHFLPERMEKMDSYTFIPFSAGPRNCIGQVFAMNEMKTTIAKLLHRFHISVDETHTVRMKPDLVLHSESGIKLFFLERRP